MRSNTSLLGRILLGIAYVRKIKRKGIFLLHSAHLIIPLRLEPPSYSRSENQKKRYFLLFFAHLIVTLSLRLLVRLHLGNAKEKRVFLLYSARFALTLYPKYEKDEETLY